MRQGGKCNKEKKMKKKLLSGLLTLAVATTSLVSLAGCNKIFGDDSVGVDTTKTQLYAVTYNGGWGGEWLEVLGKEFEEMYKDTSFEEGKKGVQVVIKLGKSDVTGDSLKNLMTTTDNDIFFSTFDLRQYNLEGKLMDVTDVVTHTMDKKYAKVWSDLGETKNISDKIDPTLRDYVLYATGTTTANAKYCGIPMYSSFYNMIYDVDLFYEAGLFIKSRNADGSLVFTEASNGDKSKEAEIDKQKWKGQDDIEGTSDDGLPMTMDDFTRVCAKMQANNITPFLWSGSLDAYIQGFATSFWANYQGAEDFKVAVSANGTLSDGTVITPATGYKLVNQKGRLQALKFCEAVVKNNWYAEDCFGSGDHYSTQNTYLRSKYQAASVQGAKRIAMLIEGGWWEHECKDVAATMESSYGEEYANRRFGVMSYPWMDANASKSGYTVVAVTPFANVAIRENPKQKELATLFFAYTTTEHALRTYTRMTGSTRCYDYDLTAEDLSHMSYYKQSLWGYYKDAKANGRVVYNCATGEFSENNPQYVAGSFGVAIALTGQNGINCAEVNPFKVFKNNNFTADQYYQATLDKITASYWQSAFLSYIK